MTARFDSYAIFGVRAISIKIWAFM